MMKSYYDLNRYLRERFGEKVIKYSLNGGFTCPNRDGRLAYGGCIFCGEKGSGEFVGHGDLDIQIAFQKKLLSKKWGDCPWIGYFQNFTNTYASVETLKSKFEPVLKKEKCVGLALATRGDCLSEEVLDYLEDLSHRTFLWVELGLQSIHPESIAFLRRAYDQVVMDKSIDALKERNILTVCHVIFGIPNENEQMMLSTIDYVIEKEIWGIKIHNLYIQEDTDLARLYEKSPFPLLTQDEYIELVTRTLLRLPENMVVHRITGDPPRRLLIAPKWSTDKLNTMVQIEKLVGKRKEIYSEKITKRKSNVFSD